jgi:hypothetical protein
VLTCRSEDAASQAVIDWLARLEGNPWIARHDLEPLTEPETTEQIELLLGARPSRALVSDTYARSEGNAFFTEQLIAAGHDQALPAGLTSLLLSRTSQVTGTARDVLGVLAVADRPLDEPSIIRLCQRSERDVRNALRELLRQRLRRPDHAGRHQLRHALLAEAVSGDLLPSERAQLHRNVADRMADSNDSSYAAQIAEHLAAADRPSDEVRWRVGAGQQANQMFAANHWRRAIVLTANAPSSQVVEGMSLADLYGAAEDDLDGSRHSDMAQAFAEEALQRLADTDPASRADVLRRAGEMRGHSDPQRALDLLYQALALYERLPPSPGHIETLRDLGTSLLIDGRQTEAAKVIDEAAALLEHYDESATVHVEILGLQAWHQMAAGDGRLALDRISVLRKRLTEADGPARGYGWPPGTPTSSLNWVASPTSKPQLPQRYSSPLSTRWSSPSVR